MTADIASAGPRPPALSAPRSVYILASGAIVAVLLAVGLPDAFASRWAVAFVIATTILLVGREDVLHGVLVTLGYLLALGLVRRLVSMVLPDPIEDPLLLVAPSLAVAYACSSAVAGALRRRSPLLLMTAGFVALSTLSVLNTSHSDLSSNVRALLFWTVPLLWFPVGRLLLDDGAVRRVARVVAVVGTGSCLAGLYQVLVGLPAWDQRWFEDHGYGALGISGLATIHPFGWAPSHTEFAQVAAIVVAISALELHDAWHARSRRACVLASISLAVSLTALALSAVMTAQILAGVAVVVVLIASGRVRARVMIASAVVVVVVAVIGVRVLDVESWHDHGVTGLVRRSLLVFGDPLEDTSLNAHYTLTRDAITGLVDDPIGQGPTVGTTTRDEDRAFVLAAENDIGNAARAFGVVGLALVLGITVVALSRAWRAARLHPGFVALVVLGILVLSLRYWWTGGHYATAMLVWLLLGHVDRPDEP